MLHTPFPKNNTVYCTTCLPELLSCANTQYVKLEPRDRLYSVKSGSIVLGT